MTLTVLRSSGQVFGRMYHTWAWSDVLLMITLGLWVLAKKTMEIKCHSHHTLPLWLIAVGGNADYLVAVVCISQVSPLQNGEWSSPMQSSFPILFWNEATISSL